MLARGGEQQLRGLLGISLVRGGEFCEQLGGLFAEVTVGGRLVIGRLLARLHPAAALHGLVVGGGAEVAGDALLHQLVVVAWAGVLEAPVAPAVVQRRGVQLPLAALRALGHRAVALPFDAARDERGLGAAEQLAVSAQHVLELRHRHRLVLRLRLVAALLRLDALARGRAGGGVELHGEQRRRRVLARLRLRGAGARRRRPLRLRLLRRRRLALGVVRAGRQQRLQLLLRLLRHVGGDVEVVEGGGGVLARQREAGEVQPGGHRVAVHLPHHAHPRHVLGDLVLALLAGGAGGLAVLQDVGRRAHGGGPRDALGDNGRARRR
mmetsp:Transcript_12690/g.46394  ORF Transcript_12690/g.46394 Transcript_12690/m.46394 type:complete len:323 (+) Transcript_12690:1900-2868(+)